MGLNKPSPFLDIYWVIETILNETGHPWRFHNDWAVTNYDLGCYAIDVGNVWVLSHGTNIGVWDMLQAQHEVFDLHHPDSIPKIKKCINALVVQWKNRRLITARRLGSTPPEGIR